MTTRFFRKEIDGETLTMPAYNAGDAVKYTYDGWREVTAEVETAKAAAKQIAAAAKPDAKADKTSR